MSGFAIALPYIILELWLFAAPGLSRDARLFGLGAIPIVVLFFLGGVAFAYFIMLPTAIPFLTNFMGMTSQLRPSSYIRFVTNIMFGVGAAFQFPLIIYVLARMGIIHAQVLKDQWRLAIVIMAVLAAAITPTVDPVNMALVMGPMLILYLLSIGLAQLAERNRAARQMAENTSTHIP
jgi:sec-independent protein translocase protein TatC